MAEATVVVIDHVVHILTETPVPTVIETPATGPQGPAGPASVTSISAPGGYVITNIRLNADKQIVITYLDEPVE